MWELLAHLAQVLVDEAALLRIAVAEAENERPLLVFLELLGVRGLFEDGLRLHVGHDIQSGNL
jgi:hypothetical protein